MMHDWNIDLYMEWIHSCPHSRRYVLCNVHQNYVLNDHDDTTMTLVSYFLCYEWDLYWLSAINISIYGLMIHESSEEGIHVYWQSPGSGRAVWSLAQINHWHTPTSTPISLHCWWTIQTRTSVYQETRSAPVIKWVTPLSTLIMIAEQSQKAT